ncbi:hypothetical protein M378DRAFT_6272 [Amanita muscaria Koide BX008]|uniref:PEHE domain-containing protein n=1 Tax=Amanita muscaria (strain Koide BX008) TaxID=946122 RepID=A0A0C2TVY7_AMAMK|nr:hypothetical protein M378DRAFT_6272 [Amanita muscaria Koide BX008]
MDSTAPLNGMQTRKKRVQPTRSRRGGPGVGSCDVDMMILETHKRRTENEPLIPADTSFLLTTDSAVVHELSSNVEVGLNPQANERYFDRPEVLKSFREQLLIETPEYVHVADLPSVGVGGRFRPRGCGDSLLDTSDATYEKRHRKYETFEKRLRLREKEKLKHEHYKLKERIDQLKSMDGAAFLSLSASFFSSLDGQEPENSDDGASTSHDGFANNSHYEGERRRKEMLDVAQSIEERYRMLLPPRKTNVSSWTEQDDRHSEEKEEPSKPEAESPPAARDTSGIKLKIKLTNPQAQVISTSVQPAPLKKSRPIALPPRPSPLRQATSQHEIEEPPQPPPSPPALPTEEVAADVSGTTGRTMEEGPETIEEEAVSPQPSGSTVGTSAAPVSIPATPMSNPEIATLEAVAPVVAREEEDELNTFSPANRSVSPVHTPKRPRLSLSLARTQEPADATPQISPTTVSALTTTLRQTSIPPIEFIHTSLSAPTFIRIRQQKQKPLSLQRANQKSKQPSSGTPMRRETTGLLMKAAFRSSGSTKSRNTMRSVTAFGVKVPQAIEEPRDFELPSWLLDPPEDEEVEAGQYSDDDGESDDDPPLAHFTFIHSHLSASANMIKQPDMLDRVPQPADAASLNFQGLHPPIETLDIPESSMRDVP